jgi:hypothetical protein
MKIGTRSLLFGVHQCLWHPLTVAFAWRKLYRKWPNWWQAIAILFHDLGYWGKENIDGAAGREHPRFGAVLTGKVVLRLGYWARRLRGREHSPSLYFAFLTACKAEELALGHSREMSKKRGVRPSQLCWADKASVFYDPKWFYLLRGKLSGETNEFRHNAPFKTDSDREWFEWYRATIRRALAYFGTFEQTQGPTKTVGGD